MQYKIKYQQSNKTNAIHSQIPTKRQNSYSTQSNTNKTIQPMQYKIKYPQHDKSMHYAMKYLQTDKTHATHNQMTTTQ